MCAINGDSLHVIMHDTAIAGDDPSSRLLRLSRTVNAALDEVDPSDDYVIIHESDIVSPVNLVERMLATGKAPLACWPTLEMNGEKTFYDTFVYRKDGRRFSKYPPYHPCYNPREPFEVDSFGTVYMFPSENVQMGMRAQTMAALDLCAWSKQHGQRLWVNPTIDVQQPASLLQPVVGVY